MNIITFIIGIICAAYGWHELDKAAKEKNWVRFGLGIALLIAAVIPYIFK